MSKLAQPEIPAVIASCQKITPAISSSSSREPNSETSSFASSSEMTREMEMVSLEVLTKLKLEEKEKFEIAYGLHIEEEALTLISSIVVRFFCASMPSNKGENFGSPNLALLQEKAVELLKKSCIIMIDRLEMNAEEISLDKYEYMLYRAFIELVEIRKEKYRASHIWASRVESEYNDLMNMWGRFMGTQWKESDVELLISDVHTHLLKEELVDLFRSLWKAMTTHDVAKVFYLVQKVGAITNDMLQSISNRSRRHVTVSPRLVAVVASPIMGVPVSWLLNSWKPPLDGIRKMFTEKLVVQTQASNAISDALSRHRPDLTRPIGSFLFLRDNGLGSGALLEALALQLFDKKQVTRFDMSEYTHADSQPCHLCVSGTCSSIGGVYNHEDHLLGRKLIEHVMKRPFSILVLHNIEKLSKCATDVVLEVLKFGRLIDREGNIADFSKTLIVMNSEVGKRIVQQRGVCKCVGVKWDSPLKEQRHVCNLLPLLNLAKRCFGKEFLDLIDDIIVFDSLSFQNYNALTRLFLRDVVDGLVEKGIVVYPSEAALRSMRSLRNKSYRENTVHEVLPLKTWLKQNVVPELLKSIAEYGNNDLSVIYLDALVGTGEISYRLKSGGPLDDEDFNCLRDQMKSWRLLHRNDKELVNKICSLRKMSLELIAMLKQDAETSFRYVAEIVEEIKSFVAFFDRNAHIAAALKEQKMAQRMSLMETSQEEQRKLITQSFKEGLGRKLSHLLGENDAFHIVADAMLECIKEPRGVQLPAKSFLFLGLSPAGKVDLIRGLAQIFGAKIVVQINMQACQKRDLLSQLSDGYFPLTLSSDIEENPYRVLIVNEVEKAHISAFDSLISMLDHGLLRDDKGRHLDFSKTIVVILSHLGNKGIIRKLLACTSGTSVVEGEDSDEPSRRKVIPNLGIKDVLGDTLGYISGPHVVHRKYYKEEEQMHFRSELLTRIDEIVLTQERPMNAARLPMKTGRHLVEGAPTSLPLSLTVLFRESHDRALQEFASSHLEKGLLKGDAIRI